MVARPGGWRFRVSVLVIGVAVTDASDPRRADWIGEEDVYGSESSAGTTVLRDVYAPIVSIHEPGDGATVSQPSIAVAGTVNDAMVGAVNGPQVSVTVNGIAAKVSNRSFLLDRLPLAVGDNTIEATAVDPSGNVGRDAVSVRREVASAPSRAPPRCRRLPLLVKVSVS